MEKYRCILYLITNLRTVVGVHLRFYYTLYFVKLVVITFILSHCMLVDEVNILQCSCFLC